MDFAYNIDSPLKMSPCRNSSKSVMGQYDGYSWLSTCPGKEGTPVRDFFFPDLKWMNLLLGRTFEVGKTHTFNQVPEV